MGRFAPSPSGDLHLGSLYTAGASYLDARANSGRWLIRIEDLDKPRVVPGSASGILRTLQEFGFEWDAEVVYQGVRIERYDAAVRDLTRRSVTFECSCSRTQLQDDERYPGHCRAGARVPGVPTATRLRVEPGLVQFTDRIQGAFRQDVAAAVGDIVLRRRDQLIAYVLAVVVDDAAQGITHIVRGADLLDNTPRQIYLQRLMGLPLPAYSHVPVLTEPDGTKLSKSARSVRLAGETAAHQLRDVFSLLGLHPDAELAHASVEEAWKWAVTRWHIGKIPRRLTLAV